MVVQDIVNSALRLCGSLDPGESPNASESTDGFNRLNDILEELSLERVNLYTIQPTTLQLTGGKAAYQIGSGGADFPNITRPGRIKGASLIPVGAALELPMGIISATAYQAIEDKAATSIRPTKLYDDYGEPYSTIYVHPVPSNAAQLKFWAWVPLGPFVTLQDVVTFPNGYKKLLQYMLAVDMAPDMKAVLDPDVAQIAAGAKMLIQKFNAMVLDDANDETDTGQIPEIGTPAVTQAPPAQIPAAPQQ